MSPALAQAGLSIVGHTLDRQPVVASLDAGRLHGVSIILYVTLVAVATIGGSALARAGRLQPIWLGAGGGGMLVIGFLHLMPDAWAGAQQSGLPTSLLVVTAIASFATTMGISRLGCACRADAQHLSGTTAGAALAAHRLLEGAAAAIGGPAVAVGLTVHAFSEGMAVGALLRPRRRRLLGWLTAMCMAPAAGVAAGTAIPEGGMAQPLLFAVAAGVLIEAARTSLSAAITLQRPRSNYGSVMPAVAALLSGLVTFMAVRAVG